MTGSGEVPDHMVPIMMNKLSGAEITFNTLVQSLQASVFQKIMAKLHPFASRVTSKRTE
jgi:hypothetical protein